jgi:hypothetical protein
LYKSENCINQAKKFGEENFEKTIKDLILPKFRNEMQLKKKEIY